MMQEATTVCLSQSFSAAAAAAAAAARCLLRINDDAARV